MEPELKAAYLVNIIKFIDWESEPSEIVICVNRESEVVPYLEALSGLELNAGRTLKTVADPDSYLDCHVLFWDRTLPRDQRTSFPDVQHGNLVTIGDISGALEMGFAIEFFIRDLKLRFAINEQTLKGADYRISSKLLRLARTLE